MSETDDLSAESRLTKLEFSFVSLCNSLDARKVAIEAALAKQRAVNEELWAWFESDCDAPISESLAAAFCEALK